LAPHSLLRQRLVRPLQAQQLALPQQALREQPPPLLLLVLLP
jgi:hypothetical protein